MALKKNVLKRLKESITAHKKRTAALLILVLLVFLIGRNLYLRTRPPVYTTSQVVRKDITQTLEVSGTVTAQKFANLHFQAAGKLAWIKVKKGDRVKKWQALAGLDRRSLEKELKKDLIAFEQERRDFAQSVDDNPLVNQKFKRILEKAQYDLDSTVIDVEIQNLSIELATLISPLDSIVTRVDAPVAGVNVTTSDMITVVDPTSLFFETEVDESDVGKVTVGQKATILLDAYPDEEIDSQVTNIDFQSTTSTGGGTVFFVRLKLPGDGEALKYRLGMTGDAELILEQKENVLTVPTDALVERNGTFSLEVLGVGNQPQTKEIAVGLSTEDEVEVLSGLNEGDTIIIPQ